MIQISYAVCIPCMRMDVQHRNRPHDGWQYGDTRCSITKIIAVLLHRLLQDQAHDGLSCFNGVRIIVTIATPKAVIPNRIPSPDSK